MDGYMCVYIYVSLCVYIYKLIYNSIRKWGRSLDHDYHDPRRPKVTSHTLVLFWAQTTATWQRNLHRFERAQKNRWMSI